MPSQRRVTIGGSDAARFHQLLMFFAAWQNGAIPEIVNPF
jgi:hypothetical protein